MFAYNYLYEESERTDTMLDDSERKIHRILHNYSVGRGRLPSMQELMIKTGKSEKDITDTLIILEDKLFIIWDDKRQVESIQLLKGWEQQLRIELSQPLDNLDYWTKY